ncbi:hypothetical protein LZ32DRAFT_176186 [Colletotrichum eremochloae]|nr:hypothetical protein LZ32DRAFT_176186 [Colletotrichum eremochloae]
MSSNPQGAVDIAKGYANLLRTQERERRRKLCVCPLCRESFRAESRRDVERHFRGQHYDYNPAIGQDSDHGEKRSLEDLIEEIFQSRHRNPTQSEPPPPPPPPTRSTPQPISSAKERGPTQRTPSETSSKRAADDKGNAPKRSRARLPTEPRSNTHGPDNEFRRDPTQKNGKLWDPDGDPPAASRRPDPRQRERETAASPRASTPGRSFEQRSPEIDTETMIKQPETRPISQEQLVAEVKGIYAGLVMVESKCIEVDNAQSSNKESSTQLNNEQWQALIALHRTLLHEHHDFFLASQHPSASPALRRLASKYAMPARMWRHGIHSFLELLRHRLPASLEHMLTFIYLAYSMMALLYETVPTFEDTWIECLGDLGRYRMAIEDDDLKDREVWTSVSRHWYSKASDKAPTTGRLYHHLAILARPNALQQLFYYTKSLCVPVPFLSARESIMTLFDPHLNGSPTRLQEIDAAFVRAHGILFSGRNSDQFGSSVDAFISNLDNQIARSSRGWMDSGYYIGISLGCAMLEYGSESNVLMRTIKSSRPDDADVQMDDSDVPASPKFLEAVDFAVRTMQVILRRFGDSNINPFFHVMLSWVFHMSQFPMAIAQVEDKLPWELISLLLNTLVNTCTSVEKIESESFPRLDKESPRPLPEDFAQRGLLWVEKYYPDDWFNQSKIDDDEKYFEVASMMEERHNRCLWLGCRIASAGKWLTYNRDARQFGVASRYETGMTEPPSAPQAKENDDGDIDIPNAPVAST